MKDINMVKKDLMEIQKSFNPEKSTYKVFDELIKHDYTSEEMINVLSKIRGVHKYPDFLKAQFLDVINSLNFIKEQDEREKQRKLKELELLKREEKTRELKDIIDNLEKGVEEKKKEKTEDLSKVPEEVKNEEDKPKDVVEPVIESNKEIENKKSVETKNDENIGKNIDNSTKEEQEEFSNEIAEPIEDDGRLMFIALTLLVIISLVLIGLFVLLY